MITEKKYSNFNISALPNNLDVLKSFFEKMNATCIVRSTEKDVYSFDYSDSFHSKDLHVTVQFNLQDTSKPSLLIRIIWDDLLNSYDIDDYANHLFTQIYLKLMEGPTRYVVRIYAKYYSARSQNLSFSFEWGNKIKVTPYYIEGRNTTFSADDRVTSSPHEQMIFFDLEVYAVNITSARTLAYNRAKEVFAYFSVLFDLGISEFLSEQVLALDYNDYRQQFFGIATNKGFYDDELDLLVFDNLNGLVTINEDNTMNLSEYELFSFLIDGEEQSTLINSNDNPQLDILFKNREVSFQNSKIEQSDLVKDITFYNTPLKVTSAHLSFFRKLRIFETNHSEKFKRFGNACKMYNKALTVCSNEPTMLISYLLASLEALLKMEEEEDYLKHTKGDMNKFLEFTKAYSTDEESYDRNYFKYLYGRVRSGHFHSGEFKFLEYSTLLNHSLSSDFINARNDYLKYKMHIREIFINWIERNILSLSNA